VLLLGSTSCRKNKNGDTTGNTAGTYYKTLTTSDGQNRSYIVYVPNNIEGQDVPVLFMIHGTNQTGQVHYDKNLWNPKAQQEGSIVVYPTALSYCHYDAGNQRITTKWAAGDLGETDVNRGALPVCTGEVVQDDMLFLDELVGVIKQDYQVDTKRLYLTGFSNGAQMTARLAAQRSEVFAAATVHAGNMSNFIPATLASRPMSIMLTVGASDGLFLNAVGATPPLAVDSSLMNITGIVNVLQPFLSVGGLDNTYTYLGTQYNGKDIADFKFETSNNNLNNYLRFTVIDDLAHSYTDILIDPFWDFLKDKSLP
jgi:poly(3-hydroxybutyrate) depolymerase